MWKGAVVLLTSVLAGSLAYQGIAPLEPKPDKFKDQSGCYVSVLDRVVPFGQSDSQAPRNEADQCEQYTCRESNVLITGCSPYLVTPPCKLVEHRDQPYPDCCKKPVCPDETQ